jgi:hypothetical protein
MQASAWRAWIRSSDPDIRRIKALLLVNCVLLLATLGVTAYSDASQPVIPTEASH